jgi:tetratricopeptide (TPR) repeat protein
MNKYKEAKKYIDLALEHDPSKDTDILKHASEIYVKLKKYDDAIDFLKQIIRRGSAENRLELEGEIKRIEQMKNGMNK